MNTPKLARQLLSSSLSSPSLSSSSLSSASSFKVSGFLSSVRGLTEKVGVVSGLTGSVKLQGKVAKAQSVISKVSQVLELNPGGGGVANGGSNTAPTVSGCDSELSLVPPAGAIVDGAEEFGKRGENLMKSTTPLKSTGEHKYYDNGWQGNQHVKTDNVFNKKVMKQMVEKAPVVGGVLDAIEVVEGMKNDGWSIGKNTAKEISGVAGGWGGALLGVKGAAAGAAVGSVVPVMGIQ